MSEKAENPRGKVIDIPLEDIQPSRWQYRRRFDADNLRELAISIREHGLINPPLVFRDPETGCFELIAGERRWRASLALGLMDASPGGRNLTGIVGMAAENPKRVIDLLGYHSEVGPRKPVPTMPVEVREGSPESFHEIAVIENLQREDITAIEEAEAFDALMVANDWTQKQLAAHLGKSAPYVSQRLSLLELAEEVKDATAAGEISFTAARAISSVPEPVQGAVAGMVEKSLQGDDPASSREVASMAGAVRRFLDPERWVPADDERTTPEVRNRFRLLRYHVEYLMANAPERAADVVQTLGNPDSRGQNYLRRKPATIAGTEYQTAEVLQVLTGADVDLIDGTGSWWGPFASLKAHTCEHCRFSEVPAPALEWDPKQAPCLRWRRAEDGAIEEAATCQNWLGPDDPAWLFLFWRFKGIVEKSDLQIELHEKRGRHYIADVEEFALALEFCDKAVAAEKAEFERQREGWLDEMRAYWQAQPVGLGPGFDLVNVQSHTCRLCANYRPDSLEDLEMPCRFALEPLTESWADQPRAPEYAVMVRADGVTVPRCERFRAAEVPALDPVRGERFPEDPDGRAEVLE